MAHTKVTKAYSANTGAANTYSYSGSFEVFKGTEVVVELDNVALTYTASTINESASPREYSVDTTAKTIHIGGANLSSGTIIIRPETDMGAPTPRATFTPGSSVTSGDLNNNQLQLMRKAMEYNEQKLSSTGGTMTGHLTIGEDQTIIFEGATDDAYETTLTVTDPTADRTITLPNVTGTVVTTGDSGTVATGMIAADAITNAKIADNALDSEHYTDGSIDAAHLASSSVTTVKIAADAVTAAKIADDVVDSEHYAAGSIDTEHIADSQVTTAKIADSNVTTAKIADANVTTAKITDANVTTAKIAADAITGAKIADDAVDSEHYAADSIDAEHYAAGSVDDTALASNAVTTGKITDANVTTVKIADDAISIAKIGCEQTTISDSDSHIPTSGAVVDYVAAQIAPIGGLEVIADEDNFPTSQPSSGVVISISDAAGIVVNGSGVSTTARTAGNGSDNVTINNFPSSLYGETLASGVGLMVTSTGSSQTYNYHKLLAAETDVKQLSDDINDFNARYRVSAGEPGSNNDEGDLVYDTNADKMKVYDSTTSAWKEVTSTGDFKYLFLCPAGGTGSPTLDGSIATYDLRESSNSGSGASVTSAAQLLVSINGVVQKANTGTSAPAEGFALVDTNTIVFGANLASGDSVFIVQFGSALTITTPGDGTVSAAKIASGAVTTVKIADANVTTAKIADDAVTAAKLASDAVVTASIVDANVTTAKIAGDAITGAKIADDAIDSEHYTDGSIDTAHIADLNVTTGKLAADAVTGAKLADDAIDSEHYTDGSIDTAHIADDQVTLAKMAGIARGKIIYGDSSGNPAVLTVGSNGQVLQSDGTDISWENAAAGATGGNSNANKIFWENENTVTHDYTIQNNHNAGSFGPITINNGVTVTVGSGEIWTIV